MDADLVHTPGGGEAADEGEIVTVALEMLFNSEAGVAWAALRVADLADPDVTRADFGGPEDGITGFPGITSGVAVGDGKIFFVSFPAFHDESEFTGGCRGFCDEDDAAGVAIEACDDGRTLAVGDFE